MPALLLQPTRSPGARSPRDRPGVARLVPSPAGNAAGPLPRPEQIEQLLRAAQTELERTWIRLVDERGHRLPDFAQPLVRGACEPGPTFSIMRLEVAIFVDGPHHDEESQRTEDRQIDERLTNAGMSVIRFHHQAEWREPSSRRYTTAVRTGFRDRRRRITEWPGLTSQRRPRPHSDPGRLRRPLAPGARRDSQQVEGVAIAPGEEVMRGGRDDRSRPRD